MRPQHEIVFLVVISMRKGGRWNIGWSWRNLHSCHTEDGDLPFAEVASSPTYKSSTRLQWCACTPAFIRAKILTPSPLLHAHSGPAAPSWFEAVVMAGFVCFFLVWQALAVFRWSERRDSLGFGAERNPNAWRRLGSRSWTEPCHAGTEGFRVSSREDRFHT